MLAGAAGAVVAEAAARDGPHAGRRAGQREALCDAVVERLGLVERHLRLEHLDGDVVERAAGALRAEPDQALVERHGLPVDDLGREDVLERRRPLTTTVTAVPLTATSML